MVTTKIRVTGLNEVRSGLHSISTGIKDTSGLVQNVGLIIERQAKKNASGRPGPKVRTGRLRSSITTYLSSPVRAIVGTNVDYAIPVEFGHAVVRRIQSTVRHLRNYIPHTWVPAYPFLFPAVGQSRDKINQLVKTWINKLIKRQA